MEKKGHETTVLNPPTSVMELAHELDAETARYVEFLLMEIKVSQKLLAEDCSKLTEQLAYNKILDLTAQIGVRSSTLAHYYQELDQALDKILILAPDEEIAEE